MASQPSREEEARAAESSRKWRKLRNVSRREGWASGTRRNAQTRTPVRGRGRAREVVGPEESLKKENQTAKRTLLPTPTPSHRFLVVENFLSCHTHMSHTNKSMALPSSRRTGMRQTAVSGVESVLGVGLGIYERVSLPLSYQTPSPAPFK